MPPDRVVASMTALRRASLSASSAVLGLTIMSAAPFAAEPDAERLDQLRVELAALRETLEADNARLSEARERSFELERSLADASTRRDELETRIKQKSTRVEVLQAARETAESHLSRHRAQLLDNAASRYVLSFQPKLKVLLHQEDARVLSRNLAYYDYVIGAFRRDTVRAAEQVQTLDRTKAALKLETNKLRRLRHEAEHQIEALKNLRAERASLVAAITRRMRDGTARVEEMERDEARLAELLSGLAQQTPLPTQPKPVAFRELEGRLAWPADGRVTKAPGMALRDGGARWAGVLIDTPKDADVRAIAAGRVVFADWFRNLGKLVIIDHGGGYMSLYGNNAALHRAAGDIVTAGDTIASVGSGEGDLPAGLYFELRAAGEPLDPRRWCVARR